MAQNQEVAETLRQLRAIPFDDMPADVPPPARALFVQLKQALRNLAESILILHPDASPLEQEAAILDALAAAGVTSSEAASCCLPWATLRSVLVRPVVGHKNLLAVMTTLAFPCGVDSSLYLFERRQLRWDMVLAVEANNYDKISGAQGGLAFSVSPPDAAGKWFVVTANHTPWCTSAWSLMRYKVSRPGQTPDQPRVLLTKGVGLYLGNGWYKLAAKQDGFSLVFQGSQGLDTDLLTRWHLANYSVAGDRVVRVAPLAIQPQDFLDEWIGLPWEEATRWTDLAKRPTIRGWHGKLWRTPAQWTWGSSIKFVQPCRGGGVSPRWQLGLEITPLKGPKNLPEILFFTIERKGVSYYVSDIATKRPPGCPGSSPPISASQLDVP
jgi:hypothetical protein